MTKRRITIHQRNLMSYGATATTRASSTAIVSMQQHQTQQQLH